MNIGEKILFLIKLKGVDQKQVARITNVSEGAVSQWISGLTSPRMRASQELSNYFEVSLDWLIDDSKTINDLHNSKITYLGINSLKKDIVKILNSINEDEKLTQIKMFLDTYKNCMS